jgi:hypothetical protein
MSQAALRRRRTTTRYRQVNPFAWQYVSLGWFPESLSAGLLLAEALHRTGHSTAGAGLSRRYA